MHSIPQKQICIACGIEKSSDEFEINSNGYLLKRCTQCSYERRKKRENAQSPEIIAERKRKRNERKIQKRRDAGIKERRKGPMPEPELRIAQRAYSQKWRKKNPEKVASQNERNKQKQWDARRERGAIEKPITPLEERTHFMIKRAEIQRNREARKRNTTVKKVDYAFILQRDAGICYICGQVILPEHPIEFDHVIPLSKGGTHTKENIKVTHDVCNDRKKAKLVSELTPYDRRGP